MRVRAHAIGVATLALGLAIGAGAVEVVGSTANLEWEPASGPVAGYFVIVARDAGPAEVEGVTLEPRQILEGAPDETLVVQVAAFGADGAMGALSDPSDPITFRADPEDPGEPLPPPPPPGDGGGGDGEPPPGEDPPPGPDGARVARDFDADGRADLLVGDGATLRIWTMQGADVASEIPLPTPPPGAQLVGAGDYDGNRTADLLWEHPDSGELTLWSLDRGVVMGSDLLDRSGLASSDRWQVGGSGDFDGDGRDDLMLWSRVSGQVELWSFADGSVADRRPLEGRVGAWSVAAVADTDGDGRAEILWRDELDRVLERRDPNAATPLRLGDLGPGWRVLGAADHDGDGASELLLHHGPSGTSELWTLDPGGVTGALALPAASALGHFATAGDHDGEGRQDLAWSDPQRGVVTLWLAAGASPTQAPVDRALPERSDLLSGDSGSDDSAFVERFCSGDLNGDGRATGRDRKRMKHCLRGRGDCSQADLDGDGVVTRTDEWILGLRIDGQACEL